jgi:hypothetical protein
LWVGCVEPTVGVLPRSCQTIFVACMFASWSAHDCVYHMVCVWIVVCVAHACAPTNTDASTHVQNEPTHPLTRTWSPPPTHIRCTMGMGAHMRPTTQMIICGATSTLARSSGEVIRVWQSSSPWSLGQIHASTLCSLYPPLRVGCFPRPRAWELRVHLIHMSKPDTERE